MFCLPRPCVVMGEVFGGVHMSGLLADFTHTKIKTGGAEIVLR